jgi:hypothetical protein
MELAASINISITEFWEITPYELSIASKGFFNRKKSEAEEFTRKFKEFQNLAITQAWLTANLARAKRMPELKKLLEDSKPSKKQMTDQEMLEQVKALNKAFGGDVINGSTQ